MKVKETLESLHINVPQQKEIEQREASTQQNPVHQEKETVQIEIVVRVTFQLNQSMLQVDEDTVKTPLKDV
jgi:hypothetical protein